MDKLPQPAAMGSARQPPLAPDSPSVVVLRAGETLVTDGSENIETLLLYQITPTKMMAFKDNRKPEK